MRRAAVTAAAALILAGGGPPGFITAAAAGETGADARNHRLIFTPRLAGPGDLVTVETDACATTATGLVYTKELAGTVMLGPVGSGDAEGSFRVPSSAKPGTYTIRGVCGDGTRVGGVLRIPDLWIGEPGA